MQERQKIARMRFLSRKGGMKSNVRVGGLVLDDVGEDSSPQATGKRAEHVCIQTGRNQKLPF